MRTTELTRRIVATVAVAAAALTGTACSDDPIVEPESTVALVVLETPGTDEGALLLTIDGPGEVSVSTVSGSHVLFTGPAAGGAVRVALVGNLGAGAVLEIEVADDIDDYEVELEQVAGRDNVLRTSLSQYSLEIDPVGD